MRSKRKAPDGLKQSKEKTSDDLVQGKEKASDDLMQSNDNASDGLIQNKKAKPGTKYKFLFRFLIKTSFFVIVLVLLLTLVFQIFRMSGNTMSPFVRDGDLCIFYRLENIYLNDVVLYEDEDGNKCVGRVVASGGQTVDFEDEGGYLVNGYSPTEEIPYETYKAETSDVQYPLVLEEDEYFVLNDFRKLDTDSRVQGAIKKSQIKGKLLFLLRRRGF